MSQWLYRLHGGQYGPVTEAQIRQLLDQKIISPTTEIWTQSFGPENWRPYESIDQLAPPPSSPPPPPENAEWHYVRAGRSIGPLSRAAIMAAHNSGAIEDATPVWRQGTDAGWKPLRESELVSPSAILATALPFQFYVHVEPTL